MASFETLKEHHLKLTERILLQPRGQIYGGQSVFLRRYAVCWYFNQSDPKRKPYGGDFHLAMQR